MQTDPLPRGSGVPRFGSEVPSSGVPVREFPVRGLDPRFLGEPEPNPKTNPGTEPRNSGTPEPRNPLTVLEVPTTNSVSLTHGPAALRAPRSPRHASARGGNLQRAAGPRARETDRAAG